MRQVNQGAIVDNKHLDAAPEMGRMIQQTTPHHRKRNNSEPPRSSQSFSMFSATTTSTAAKVDGWTLCKPKLKRGPRLSDEEIVARGFTEYAPSSISSCRLPPRAKTGVTEPAACAAGPRSQEPRRYRLSGGVVALLGWLHAAPAATNGCQF